MRELSLFTGDGGGLLGSKLLGFQNVGYVESNIHSQKIISQRIKDGILNEAPIFTDVRAFASIAKYYKGFADVVAAGFPCQPFSVAGKQKADSDERNMWPATIDVIRKVKPRIVYLENVQGLLSVCDESAGYIWYIQQIFRDLAEAGYDARWCLLGADDCNGPHRRKRLWILAHSKSERIQRLWTSGKQEPYSHDRSQIFMRDSKGFNNASWKAEPRMDRVVDGVADRVDRIKALGNGQVPVVAATAFKLLMGEL